MAESTSVNKNSVGIAAIACLATAGGFLLFAPEREGALAAFWRVGLVMSALWLALPRKGEKFAWSSALPMIIGAVVLIGVGKNGKVLIALLPLVIVAVVLGLLIRPKPKRRTEIPPTKR